MDNKDLLKIESLLFNYDDLLWKSEQEKEIFQNYVLDTLNIDSRLFYTHYILVILNEAKQINEKEYLREVFLEWVYIQRNTNSEKTRIFNLFGKLSEINDPIEYKTELINLYRSIVSELLDPYLTLLYASIKFKEGTFTTITEANYEQGEISKYEFIKSRDQSKGFLRGYNSNVRNAISHNNIDSIEFIDDKIIFKNIKRTSPPRVTRVEWDLATLENNLLDLLEFVLSIDVCVNIFGIDNSKSITNNIDLLMQFIQKTMDENQRREQREIFKKPLNAIFYSSNLTLIEKFNVLSKVFIDNLRIRGMEILNIGYNEKGQKIIIEIPINQYNDLDDDELRKRALEFSRYAIIARGIFLIYFLNS